MLNKQLLMHLLFC